MNILIAAATKNEINPMLEHFKMDQVQNGFYCGQFRGHTLNCVITGIGMVAAAVELTLAIKAKRYDFVLNTGIAGAYSANMAIGSVVNVCDEIIGDLGIDDHGKFSTVFESGLAQPDTFPYFGGSFCNTSPIKMFSALKTAKGLTANTVSGSEELINQRKQKFNPDVETMEGAVVFYVCLRLGINFAEIRAVSNYVEPRNRANWNISLAITNLNSALIDIFEANL